VTKHLDKTVIVPSPPTPIHESSIGDFSRLPGSFAAPWARSEGDNAKLTTSALPEARKRRRETAALIPSSP